MKWKVLYAYSVTVLLWGSAFPAIKFGLQSYSPGHLAALRLFIGAIGLTVFAVVRKIKLPDLRDVPAVLLLGFLGFAVYHTALSYGENSVSAGESSLIVSTTPIFSAILAALFLKEPLPKIGWLGSVIAFLGVAMISFGKDDSLAKLSLGALWILTAALGESFYFVFQSKYLKKYGFLPFTVYTIIAGAVCMLFFFTRFGRRSIKGFGIIDICGTIFGNYSNLNTLLCSGLYHFNSRRFRGNQFSLFDTGDRTYHFMDLVRRNPCVPVIGRRNVGINGGKSIEF